MRSPEVSGVTRLLLKASFQSYLPFGVSPYLKNGPTVCDGVNPLSCTYLVSIGVALRPRSTMVKREHSAQFGWVFSRSNDDTIRIRALSSGTELKIGSNSNKGSPGKYIWVTSREMKA